MRAMIIYKTIIWIFNRTIFKRMAICTEISFTQFKKRSMKMMEAVEAIRNDKF